MPRKLTESTMCYYVREYSYCKQCGSTISIPTGYPKSGVYTGGDPRRNTYAACNGNYSYPVDERIYLTIYLPDKFVDGPCSKCEAATQNPEEHALKIGQEKGTNEHRENVWKEIMSDYKGEWLDLRDPGGWWRRGRA